MIEVYESLVREDALRQDEPQYRVAKKLGKLSELLRSYKAVPSTSTDVKPQKKEWTTATKEEKKQQQQQQQQQQKEGNGLEGSIKKEIGSSSETKAAKRAMPKVLRGMYIHGKVCGGNVEPHT